MNNVVKISDDVKMEMEYLLGIWKDIVIKYSNSKFCDLKPHLREALTKTVKSLGIKNFHRDRSIASQIDRYIVDAILADAVILNEEGVIDMIYKRTRSSMFQYFRFEQIIISYISLGKIDKAIDVLEYMLNKEHYAYWYAVYNLNKDLINKLVAMEPGFKDKFKNVKDLSIMKLLRYGEKVTLEDMGLEDIKNLLSKI